MQLRWIGQIKEAAESDIHTPTFQLLDAVSGIDEEHIYRGYELTNGNMDLGNSETSSNISEDASQTVYLEGATQLVKIDRRDSSKPVITIVYKDRWGMGIEPEIIELGVCDPQILLKSHSKPGEQLELWRSPKVDQTRPYVIGLIHNIVLVSGDEVSNASTPTQTTKNTIVQRYQQAEKAVLEYRALDNAQATI